MTTFIVITYDIEFSDHVINYFKSKNTINVSKFSFLGVGINEGKENDILKNIEDKLMNTKKLERVIIFSDAGLPAKLSKRISLPDENIKIFRSKGSLIENGYLAYILINTCATDEIICKALKAQIEK